MSFAFPPIMGRSVTIELTDDSSNRDASGNIIEITGLPDPASAAGKSIAKATLSIVEIEMYGPLRAR